MVRLADRPDMILDVYRDVKQQHHNNNNYCIWLQDGVSHSECFKYSVMLDIAVAVVAVLLFYVQGKHPWSYLDGQLT